MGLEQEQKPLSPGLEAQRSSGVACDVLTLEGISPVTLWHSPLKIYETNAGLCIETTAHNHFPSRPDLRTYSVRFV